MTDPDLSGDAGLEVSDDTGVVTLNLSGSLEEGDVVPTTRAARELLRPAGVHSLIVDLAAVTFVDSSGLGMLVSLRQLAEDRGAHFTLRHVPEKVSQLFEFTGLMGYLAAE